MLDSYLLHFNLYFSLPILLKLWCWPDAAAVVDTLCWWRPPLGGCRPPLRTPTPPAETTTAAEVEDERGDATSAPTDDDEEGAASLQDEEVEEREGRRNSWKNSPFLSPYSSTGERASVSYGRSGRKKKRGLNFLLRLGFPGSP